MKDRYNNDLEGALINIESQLGGGYLDLVEDWDKTEMDIIKEAIRLGVAKINFGTEIRYKYVEHYQEALKTNHQGHSWKLSQFANEALTEDIKKIISLAGSEGKA